MAALRCLISSLAFEICLLSSSISQLCSRFISYIYLLQSVRILATSALNSCLTSFIFWSKNQIFSICFFIRCILICFTPERPKTTLNSIMPLSNIMIHSMISFSYQNSNRGVGKRYASYLTSAFLKNLSSIMSQQTSKLYLLLRVMLIDQQPSFSYKLILSSCCRVLFQHLLGFSSIFIIHSYLILSHCLEYTLQFIYKNDCIFLRRWLNFHLNNTLILGYIMSTNLKVFQSLKQNFLVSTFTQEAEQRVSLLIYLIHSKSKEVLVVQVKDSLRVDAKGMRVDLSPELIADIIHRNYDKVLISEGGEISIPLQLLSEKLQLKLPPARIYAQIDTMAQIRLLQHEKRCEARVSLLQQTVTRLLQKVEALEDQLISAQKEIKYLSEARQTSSPSLNKHSSSVDQQTKMILVKMKQQQQKGCPYTVAEDFVQNVQKVIEQKIQDLQQYNAKSLGQITTNFMEVVNLNMKSIYNKMESIENRLEIIQKERDPANIQAKIMKIISSENKQQASDLFQQQQAQSDITTISTNKSVQIKNKGKKPEGNYCYFFSKLVLRGDCSMRLQFRKGEKPLFGICSRQALRQKPIYKHKSSYFHTVGDETRHIGGEFKYQQSIAQELHEEQREVVMGVSLTRGTIVWDNGTEWPVEKELLDNCEFHVAILMKENEQNDIHLTYSI